MSQEKIDGFDSSSNKKNEKEKNYQNNFQCKNIKNTNKVRVVHGANQQYLDLEGKTVGYVKTKLKEVLNIPSDANALIGGVEVGDEIVIEGNQTLEFIKEAGIKGC
jgi:hypothetical protein